MWPFSVPLQEVTLEHIDELVDGLPQETRSVEYRGIMPEANKTRFLRTAAAFANADGGVLLFGVQETGAGKPNVGGLQTLDYDRERRRLLQALRSATDPPITEVQTRQVEANGRRPVVLMWV